MYGEYVSSHPVCSIEDAVVELQIDIHWLRLSRDSWSSRSFDCDKLLKYCKHDEFPQPRHRLLVDHHGLLQNASPANHQLNSLCDAASLLQETFRFIRRVCWMSLNQDVLRQILSHFDQPHQMCRAALVLKIPVETVCRLDDVSVDACICCGYVEVLDVLYQHRGNDLAYNQWSLENACMKGHVCILRWLQDHGFQIRASKKAMDNASRQGHVEVLQWWKESGLQLSYSKNLIEHAALDNYVDVFIWWLESGLTYSANPQTVSEAVRRGHFQLAFCWFDSDKVPKPNSISMVGIYDITLLNGWMSHGMLYGTCPKDVKFEFHEAAIHGEIQVMDFFYTSGLDLTYFSDTLYFVSTAGFELILEWFKQKEIVRLCHPWLVKAACTEAEGNACAWWQENMKLIDTQTTKDPDHYYPCISSTINYKKKCITRGNRITFFN